MKNLLAILIIPAFLVGCGTTPGTQGKAIDAVSANYPHFVNQSQKEDVFTLTTSGQWVANPNFQAGVKGAEPFVFAPAHTNATATISLTGGASLTTSTVVPQRSILPRKESTVNKALGVVERGIGYVVGGRVLEKAFAQPRTVNPVSQPTQVIDRPVFTPTPAP